MTRGSAALAAAGAAGAALLGSCCCWRWRQAAVSVIMCSSSSGEQCRRSASGAAPRDRHDQWQLRKHGGGSGCRRARALRRRAGALLNQSVEQLCSIKGGIGFCRRLCFQCPVPASGCLGCKLKCSPASFTSIRKSYGRSRISSGSSL